MIDLNRCSCSPSRVRDPGAKKWLVKHDAMLLSIRIKQDEQLVSRLEEAVTIFEKDEVVQKRASI